MRMRLLLPCAALIGGLFLAGCDDNPTNAPSEEAVKKSNADRAAAVDNDPSLTPEQKELMKSHMGLGPKGAATPAERK